MDIICLLSLTIYRLTEVCVVMYETHLVREDKCVRSDLEVSFTIVSITSQLCSVFMF